jgi:hypothetical protein
MISRKDEFLWRAKADLRGRSWRPPRPAYSTRDKVTASLLEGSLLTALFPERRVLDQYLVSIVRAQENADPGASDDTGEVANLAREEA